MITGNIFMTYKEASSSDDSNNPWYDRRMRFRESSAKCLKGLDVCFVTKSNDNFASLKEQHKEE